MESNGPIDSVWMETATGLQFNPNDRIQNFDMKDLIAGVSRICRYNGQIRDDIEIYSVAEHLCILHDWAKENMPELTDQERRTLIMHDMQEGLMGDMVRPLKALIPEFCDWEEEVERVLAKRYDLIWPHPAFVKELDNRIIANERQWVMNASGHEWFCDSLEPLHGARHRNWLPSQARRELVRRLNWLGIMT